MNILFLQISRDAWSSFYYFHLVKFRGKFSQYPTPALSTPILILDIDFSKF